MKTIPGRLTSRMPARLPKWKSSAPLRTGDWVEVLSEAEILATLDVNGRRDGLPFMPEMLRFAGTRFRVLARADKTCDTVSKTGGRRMRNTVHLETRCDGGAHGGCQAACLLFWNEAWLKRVDGPAVNPSPSTTVTASVCTRQRLEAATRQTPGDAGTLPDDVRYRCQATALLDATTPLAWWDVRQYWRDWRSGNVRIGQMLRVFAMASVNAVQRRRGGGLQFPRMVDSTLTKTPTATLDVRPGELVQIKSVDAIAQTLDANGKNRGLWFDAEMVPFCGKTFRVDQRVDKIIDERTGRMLHFPTPCLMLEGVVCRSQYSRRRLFCPRRIPSYWREIWVSRVQSQASAIPAPTPRVSVGVPVYNGERFLEGVLDALLAQTYSDFELIIGDNASTDRTEEIARACAARDSRVRYVRHPRNLGVAANFQRLFELARGELFRWHAADDLCAPELLARCVDALDARPEAVLAYSKACLIDDQGNPIEEYEDDLDLRSPQPSERFREFFNRVRLCNAQYGVIRSAALRRTGGLRSFIGSDIVLLAELALHGAFHEVPARLFFRRFHADASSAQSMTSLKEYYTPDRRAGRISYEWRHLGELGLALSRAPIAFSEKARVTAQLLQRARWNRGVLARELWRGTSDGLLVQRYGRSSASADSVRSLP